ncbi:APG9-domain-containing protein [Polychytrium aggregatum]|uniref:APG9-domain-containing protein n=1 Tax=Polychytrium aggregatum TaxID=110093 RepID=UPI0022FDE4A1|nr:APG9-domain-containing protein [Polychytrium aggregatum]KAI9205012.1 APG9-domain-containing protein [Polychytrium aggregatum]
MYRSLLGSHLRKTAKLLRRGLGLPYPRPRARRGAHGDGGAPTSPSAASTQHPRVTRATLEARERAYRIWVEVRDLDQFLSRVYYHYTGKGVYAIILARFTNLFILAFIVVFSTFLFYCIDYPLIHDKKYLYEVVHQNCVSRIHGIPYTTMIIFIIWWVYQMARLIMDIPKLFEVNAFYVDLLGIGNSELQTIKWRDVVARILEINNTSADTRHGNLDSYIIANRIMRYDNYMIALFNKDLLDLKVPFLPFFGSRMFLTKIIEWNLQFCIFYYIFDEKGRMRKHFLKDRNSQSTLLALPCRLRQRFITMGIINLVVSPFLVILLVMYFFFRYAEEFQKNPGKISARQYTPEAAWRFREFNELPHLLQERMNRSYENAVKYLEQFPKEWMIILARFVSFIAGSFAAVLTVITLVDQDILLGFELHPGGSVLFYIGIFGSILAVSRGMVPAEYTLFEPERLIRTVANDTHYLPPEWKKRLHTEEVKTEFSSLFDIKVATFLKEILSIFLVPLIFCFSLPKSCEAIIDFFRNFTVHEESLGHVCSFAVFDFKKHGNSMYGAPTGTQDDYFMSKGGKMEQSFLNFKVRI